jgi:hypothetical protein
MCNRVRSRYCLLIADHIVAARELALPMAVADDGNGVAAGGFVVIGSEDAPEGRAEAQDLEVGAGDEIAVDPLGFAIGADAEGRSQRQNMPLKTWL